MNKVVSRDRFTGLRVTFFESEHAKFDELPQILYQKGDILSHEGSHWRKHWRLP